MQAQRWPSIRMLLVYAFLVGKVARASLLDTLYQTISSSLQMVSAVSGTPATLRRLFRGRLDAAVSNNRSASLCNAPLKRVA